MKKNYIFLVVLLNQLIGYCIAMRDDANRGGILPENVQLTEYKNGEIIELEQQDFNDLKKKLLNEKPLALFNDVQFPEESFCLEANQVLRRPKKIVNEPNFFSSGHKLFHLKQGYVGDCWFIVGLLHLRKNRNLFDFIVNSADQTFDDDNYAGIFHFRFWQAGTWVDVVIDDQLAFDEEKNELVYASSGNTNEFWASLIEKAYAKLVYRSYKKLGEGGHSGASMQDMTGGIIETFIINENYTDFLFDHLKNTISESVVISVGSKLDSNITNNDEFIEFGLTSNHFYAITAVQIIKNKYLNQIINLIRIQNPHGEPSLNPHPGNISELLTTYVIETQLKIQVPGESWILLEDFIKYFDYIEICNLTPNPIIGNVYGKKHGKKLSLSAIEGKFIGGINRNEISNKNLLKICPQYRLVLKKADKGETTCDILIGLSLKHRQDLVMIMDTIILFRIIHADNNQEIPKPLVQYNKNRSHPVATSKGQVSLRIELNPHSTYYIIPCVGKTFKGATFHLQVLSQHKTILEEYDQDIVIPSIADKFNDYLKLTNIENIDLQLFSSKANDEDQTIDFKSLYDIFKDNKFSLNLNCRFGCKLDNSIIPVLNLLSVTKKFVPHRKLSISSITKITSTYQQIFERYDEPLFSGYTSCVSLITALNKSGYFIKDDILHSLYSFCSKENNLIHFNDFMLIVFTLKSQTGLYCEKLNAKLCQDLIAMVHNNIPQSNIFDKSVIHNLRIDINQFKIITRFINELKEKYNNYASKSSYSVSYRDFKDILESIGYKLPYKLIEMIFSKYRNDVDIFYHQFLEVVVDTTHIFKNIQASSLNEKDQGVFYQYWKNKHGKKNKRKADSAWNNESPSKRQKMNK